MGYRKFRQSYGNTHKQLLGSQHHVHCRQCGVLIFKTTTSPGFDKGLCPLCYEIIYYYKWLPTLQPYHLSNHKAIAITNFDYNGNFE